MAKTGGYDESRAGAYRESRAGAKNTSAPGPTTFPPLRPGWYVWSSVRRIGGDSPQEGRMLYFPRPGVIEVAYPLESSGLFAIGVRCAGVLRDMIGAHSTSPFGEGAIFALNEQSTAMVPVVGLASDFRSVIGRMSNLGQSQELDRFDAITATILSNRGDPLFRVDHCTLPTREAILSAIRNEEAAQTIRRTSTFHEFLAIDISVSQNIAGQQVEWNSIGGGGAFTVPWTEAAFNRPPREAVFGTRYFIDGVLHEDVPLDPLWLTEGGEPRPLGVRRVLGIAGDGVRIEEVWESETSSHRRVLGVKDNRSGDGHEFTTDEGRFLLLGLFGFIARVP